VASRSERRVLEDVASCIRIARLRSGLTQEEAASRGGIDYKRWQQLEQGRVNATLRTLVRVARGCGVTFWQLLTLRPPESEDAPSPPRSARAKKSAAAKK
jgi:transcriptional regulator with XRE-family HTH domain